MNKKSLNCNSVTAELPILQMCISFASNLRTMLLLFISLILTGYHYKTIVTSKVLDQITLEKMLFELCNVGFYLRSSSKVEKKPQICILFWSSRKKWRLESWRRSPSEVEKFYKFNLFFLFCFDIKIKMSEWMIEWNIISIGKHRLVYIFQVYYAIRVYEQ